MYEKYFKDGGVGGGGGGLPYKKDGGGVLVENFRKVAESRVIGVAQMDFYP